MPLSDFAVSDPAPGTPARFLRCTLYLLSCRLMGASASLASPRKFVNACASLRCSTALPFLSFARSAILTLRDRRGQVVDHPAVHRPKVRSEDGLHRRRRVWCQGHDARIGALQMRAVHCVRPTRWPSSPSLVDLIANSEQGKRVKFQLWDTVRLMRHCDA